MPAKPTPEEHEAIEITRLVDDRSIDVEADTGDIAGRPEIRRQIESQRRVSDALSAGGPAVPDRLVRAVEAKVADRYGRAAASSRRRGLMSGPAWRPAVAVAGLAVICAAVVIAVAGSGGSSNEPSIPAAASLAFAPSVGAAPAAHSATLLDVAYGGVTYPNYAKFSVPPTGTRTDRIGGRPALTVFYRLPNGTRLSYTVFSGKAVPLPGSARVVRFEGVPLHEFSTSSGLSVVTLVRFGRTCVLAARTKPDVVLGLAAAPLLEQAHA